MVAKETNVPRYAGSIYLLQKKEDNHAMSNYQASLLLE